MGELPTLSYFINHLGRITGQHSVHPWGESWALSGDRWGWWLWSRTTLSTAKVWCLFVTSRQHIFWPLSLRKWISVKPSCEKTISKSLLHAQRGLRSVQWLPKEKILMKPVLSLTGSKKKKKKRPKSKSRTNKHLNTSRAFFQGEKVQELHCTWNVHRSCANICPCKQRSELKDAEQGNVPVLWITGLLLLPAHSQGLPLVQGCVAAAEAPQAYLTSTSVKTDGFQ